MSVLRFLICSVLAALVLFFWSGISQMFPWGVPSAQEIRSQSAVENELFWAPDLLEFEANRFTTAEFDAQMVDQVTTLATDETFSWIVTKPIDYYSPTAYFIREFVTQLFVGVFLVGLAVLIRPLSMPQKLGVFGLAALLASAGMMAPLYNWWGLPPAYAFGVSANLLVGWLLVGWGLNRWAFPRGEEAVDYSAGESIPRNLTHQIG